MAVPTALNPLMVQDDQPLASQTNGLLPPVAFAAPPTQADAMDYNAQAVGNYVTQQRAQAQAQGLWDPATGMPTRAGAMDAANQLSGGLLMGSTAPGIRAFHGSPHSFDQFSLDKIGTGEGAQAYGHGLYFAGNEGVAQGYRDKLTVPGPTIAGRTPDPADPSHIAAVALAQHGGSAADAATAMQHVVQFPHVYGTDAKTATEAMGLLHSGAELPAVQLDTPGSMYDVNINADPAHFLDWDKPLSEQSQAIQDFARNADISGAKGPTKGALQAWREGRDVGLPATGQMLHRAIADYGNNGAAAAEQLKAAGIPGIRYLDGGSRGAGEGTSNTVVFDPATIEILRKYGIAGLMAGGAAAGSQQ